MDNRLGRIAGVAAFGLMMGRLSRLIESGGSAPSWQLIMVASAFLGGVVWWLLRQTVSRARLAAGLFILGGTILFLRISSPENLVAGFIPTPDTVQTLSRELATSIDLIRFGIAPVSPTPGIMAILAGLMWIIGGLFMRGASEGPTMSMALPSLALYLEFAVMDRRRLTLGWMAAATTVIALAMVAVATERRIEAGRVRTEEGRPVPRQTRVTAIALASVIGFGAVAVTAAASDLVPPFGKLQLGPGNGYGPGYNGVSFDRLADLRQLVIERSNQVMFTAVLDANAPSASQIYWRMESLDDFDGAAWRPGGVVGGFFQPGRAGGNPDYAYRGSAQQIAARIKIDKLRSEVVPTAGIALDIEADEVNLSILRVAEDGSVIYQPGLNQDDEYVITALLPLERQDIGALASTPEGAFSPVFARAQEAGLFNYEPNTVRREQTRPEGLDRFVALPDGLPLAVRAEAVARTKGASTDFERAWLLQYWFRDSGEFSYSTSVSSGFGSLQLEQWLTDPTSLNYHVGYCEQFAASMAVLGRTLGIPSRVVWGFTPGQTQAQSDGTEIVVVRDNNAHAWVEMWMDGFGWVKFDPTPRGGGVLPSSVTAGFNPIAFLEAPTPPAANANRPNPFDRPNLLESELGGGALPERPGFPWGWLLVIPPAIAALGIVPWAKATRRRRRLARLRDGDITAAWHEMVDRLADLGQPIPPQETPLEFASRTDESLVSLASNYSAAVYGGRNGMATSSDLEIIEDWLRRRYEGGQRIRAAFNPRSLLRSD